MDALFERGAGGRAQERGSSHCRSGHRGGRRGPTPRLLALTVATNEEARALNEATRGLLVSRGNVDDDVVATGMGEVRIGVGDRVVTRRNDCSLGVDNRQAWQVAAVGPDGSSREARAVRRNRRVWADIEAVHEGRQRPLMEVARLALEEVKRVSAERARLTKAMSPGTVRAADRARDAYLERDRHRAPFERSLGRSPSRGGKGLGSTCDHPPRSAGPC